MIPSLHLFAQQVEELSFHPVGALFSHHIHPFQDMKHPSSSIVDVESPPVKELLLPELICNVVKLLLLTIRNEFPESLPHDHVVAMDLSDVCAREDLYTVFVNPSSEVAKFDAIC